MLRVENLTVKFPSRFGDVTAVEDMSLSIKPGEIHGLVGESGAGKSTVGAAIIGLLQKPGYVAEGTLKLGDTDLRKLDRFAAHQLRGKRISMIFQDPQTSLNPLMRIEDQLVETILSHEDIPLKDAQKRAVDLLEEMGIENAAARMQSYPHQFSGGQRQRICIARSLALNPKFIICDESVSALDVSVQAQVLNLLKELQEEFELTYIFISHDLSVVKFISDRILVMNRGEIVETGSAEQIYREPKEEYTQKLIASIPTGSPERMRNQSVNS